MIVADTGPLLRVKELQASELLVTFAPVVIPHLVALECARYEIDLDSPVFEVRAAEPPRESLAAIVAEVRTGIIQPAEAEAIAWALHDRADWLLTDDANARALAQRLGISVHGSLGLVLRNAQVESISKDRAGALLRQLSSGSLWVSGRVLEEALRLLEDLG